MTIPPKMYGIWQPGLGWVKAYKKGSGGPEPYATFDKAIARDIARRIGGGARVEYIDDALAVMELEFLKEEERPKWWQVRKWKVWNKLETRR